MTTATYFPHWDQIVPGSTRPTHPTTLTAAQIIAFARATGETDPIHLDPAYARSTPDGRLRAPPGIHAYLLYACTPQDDWMRTPGTVNAGQAWSYHLPAYEGDVITLSARALDRFIRKGRLFVVHDNVFTNQDRAVICAGRGWTIRPL